MRLAAGAASHHGWLKPYLTDSADEINEGVDHGKKVLVEGTQGFGLSLYHSTVYPKTTSRDTSVAGCISECGISPRLVTDIVMVLRTFPIRVAGQQAGPMYEEIDWETVQRESGYPTPLAEFTTVTGKLRRVARFDFDLARHAIKVNRPTELALNFLDYLDYRNRRAADRLDLTESTKAFLENVEKELGVHVGFAGVGPSLSETMRIEETTIESQELCSPGYVR